MKRIYITGLLLFILLLTSFGQIPEKKRYQATKITSAPLIDGILDEQLWQDGEWNNDFTQYEPYNGRNASQQTQFKILFDENNLYVAFIAFDSSPDSIVKRMTRRDNIDGDMLAIVFDSYHDLRTGFLFGVSAANIKFDQMITEDGNKSDESWDPNWWVKSSVNSDGWVAEMKIPFSQLRFDKNSGGIWGLEVLRLLFRKNEMSFWNPIPKDAPGIIHMAGELSGLQQIKPRKIFDITPYGVARTERYRPEPGNPFATGKKNGLNGGIDAKIGVTNNLTLDLTINPDFGQVEADPSEVNLTAYETFLNEKRPFFIEGNNITSFGIGIGDGGVGNDNLFYSRRIGRKPQYDPDLNDDEFANIPSNTTIIGAAKLTGKTKNGISLGFIESLTSGEIARIYNGENLRKQTVEPLTNYFVSRVQKDFNKGNTIIGGILTSTNRNLDDILAQNLHKSAYTGGFDFTQYFKDKNWMFNVNAAFSKVNGTREALYLTQTSSARYFQRPGNDHVNFDTMRTSLAGSGGRMQLAKMNGHWNYIAVVLWKTPGLELNDIGYLREADQLLLVLWAQYKVWEPKSFYRSYNISLDQVTNWDFGGTHISDGFEANGNLYFKNFWNLSTYGSVTFNKLSNSMLRGGPAMKVPGNINGQINLGTDSRKKLAFSVFTMLTKGFTESSHSISTSGNISYKPSNSLTLSFNPGYNSSFTELQYISKAEFNGQNRYIYASIDRKVINASFRINFNISPDLTVQYWGQPFVASGRYYTYKYITDPMANEYRDRFHIYNGTQIRFDGNTEFKVDENTDGSNDYTFEKPDFNIQEFLSNFVVRWEYNPGSSLYFVWSQTRSDSNDSGEINLNKNVNDLFTCRPHNVFLIKFSYRFGI
jgi:hypothetical protein